MTSLNEMVESYKARIAELRAAITPQTSSDEAYEVACELFADQPEPERRRIVADARKDFAELSTRAALAASKAAPRRKAANDSRSPSGAHIRAERENLASQVREWLRGELRRDIDADREWLYTGALRINPDLKKGNFRQNYLPRIRAEVRDEIEGDTRPDREASPSGGASSPPVAEPGDDTDRRATVALDSAPEIEYLGTLGPEGWVDEDLRNSETQGDPATCGQELGLGTCRRTFAHLGPCDFTYPAPEDPHALAEAANRRSTLENPHDHEHAAAAARAVNGGASAAAPDLTGVPVQVADDAARCRFTHWEQRCALELGHPNPHVIYADQGAGPEPYCVADLEENPEPDAERVRRVADMADGEVERHAEGGIIRLDLPDSEEFIAAEKIGPDTWNVRLNASLTTHQLRTLLRDLFDRIGVRD